MNRQQGTSATIAALLMAAGSVWYAAIDPLPTEGSPCDSSGTRLDLPPVEITAPADTLFAICPRPVDYGDPNVLLSVCWFDVEPFNCRDATPNTVVYMTNPVGPPFHECRRLRHRLAGDTLPLRLVSCASNEVGTTCSEPTDSKGRLFVVRDPAFERGMCDANKDGEENILDSVLWEQRETGGES